VLSHSKTGSTPMLGVGRLQDKPATELLEGRELGIHPPNRRLL
jgi:hypothetical protein